MAPGIFVTRGKELHVPALLMHCSGAWGHRSMPGRTWCRAPSLANEPLNATRPSASLLSYCTKRKFWQQVHSSQAASQTSKLPTIQLTNEHNTDQESENENTKEQPLPQSSMLSRPRKHTCAAFFLGMPSTQASLC